MSEHDTPTGGSGPEAAGTVSDEAFRQLDGLVCRCIGHLRNPANILKPTFPNDRKYLSQSVEKKIAELSSVVDGVKCGKGFVWDKATRKKIKIGPAFGNLYALHVRLPRANDWRLKYVGVAKDLNKRLKEHIAGSSKSTSSQNWMVACELHNGNKIGFSFSNVVRTMSADDALCRYVELRIIEWLEEKPQVEKWGPPWNKKKG